MKFLKFNSFKTGIVFACFYAILNVLLMNLLSLIVTDDLSKLLKALLILFMIYILKNIFKYLHYRQISITEYYLKREFYYRIDSRYEKMKIDEFEQKSVGSRATVYVNDVSKLINLTMNRLINIVFDFTIIIFALISLFLIHYLLFLLGIILLLIMYLLPKLFEKNLSNYISVSQKTTEEYLKKMTENLSGFSTFVQNHCLNIFRRKSMFNGEQFADDITNADQFAAFMSAFLTAAGDIFTLFALFIVSFFVVKGRLKAGFLLSVLSLIPFLSDTVGMLVSDYTFYKAGKDLYEKRFSKFDSIYLDDFTKPFLFKRKKVSVLELKEKNFIDIKSISLKDLCVNYNNKSICYDDLVFEKNKKYLIVGKSGFGKSSLLKILSDGIHNYTGEVLINGKNIKELDILNSIAYIDQHTFLFNDTIAKNLNVSSEKANELLKLVGLDEFDAKYMITENGKNLSGGQKQKIAILRALAREKRVIFADEITSSLDDKAAYEIIKLLLNKNIMLIMITHKIDDNLKKRFDHIINLEEHAKVKNV